MNDSTNTPNPPAQEQSGGPDSRSEKESAGTPEPPRQQHETVLQGEAQTGSVPSPVEAIDQNAGERRDLDEAAGFELLEELPRLPRLQSGPARTQRLVRSQQKEESKTQLSPEQRLLLLDTWRRSGLTAFEFGALVGVSKESLYVWKKRFDKEGPAGLFDRPRRCRQTSRLAEATQRAILMLKADNPEWGCQRISDVLVRAQGLGASAAQVASVLHQEGYELEEQPTRAHAQPTVRYFERVKCNQLWQTDIFTFLLQRQNRRIYLVAFMDDHSRFMVAHGLAASMMTPQVIEVLRSGIASFSPPEELLTDNGPQYVTWRGKSSFTKECEARGIRQIVARPRRPQTLGKIERFWGTLWRECLQAAVFIDLEDARKRIAHFVDYYNFLRPHQGIDGLVPADRYFGAANQVREMLQARVADNALSLAVNGIPKDPFYLTGQMGGKNFSLHAEGERMILTTPEGERREVDLCSPAQGQTADLGQSKKQQTSEAVDVVVDSSKGDTV